MKSHEETEAEAVVRALLRYAYPRAGRVLDYSWERFEHRHATSDEDELLFWFRSAMAVDKANVQPDELIAFVKDTERYAETLKSITLTETAAKMNEVLVENGLRPRF